MTKKYRANGNGVQKKQPRNPHTKQSQGYRHRDKDPILDLINSFIARDGRTLTQIARDAHMAVGTLQRWDSGDTLAPQHRSVALVLEALGIRHTVQRPDEDEIVIPTMRASIEAHVKATLRKIEKTKTKAQEKVGEPKPPRINELTRVVGNG